MIFTLFIFNVIVYILFIFSVFDVLSQFAMLYMLLSLSLGWTLGTSYRSVSHLHMISKKPAARVVGVLAIIQVNFILSSV